MISKHVFWRPFNARACGGFGQQNGRPRKALNPYIQEDKTWSERYGHPKRTRGDAVRAKDNYIYPCVKAIGEELICFSPHLDAWILQLSCSHIRATWQLCRESRKTTGHIPTEEVDISLFSFSLFNTWYDDYMLGIQAKTPSRFISKISFYFSGTT